MIEDILFEDVWEYIMRKTKENNRYECYEREDKYKIVNIYL